MTLDFSWNVLSLDACFVLDQIVKNWWERGKQNGFVLWQENNSKHKKQSEWIRIFPNFSVKVLSIPIMIARSSAQNLWQDGGGNLEKDPKWFKGSQIPTPVEKVSANKIVSAQAGEQIKLLMKHFPHELSKAEASHRRLFLISIDIGTCSLRKVLPSILIQGLCRQDLSNSKEFNPQDGHSITPWHLIKRCWEGFVKKTQGLD